MTFPGEIPADTDALSKACAQADQVDVLASELQLHIPAHLGIYIGTWPLVEWTVLFAVVSLTC